MSLTQAGRHRSHDRNGAAGSHRQRARRLRWRQGLSGSTLANAVSTNAAIGSIGSREQQGIYLLQDGGAVQQLWAKEQDATWLSGDEAAGILVSAPDVPTGSNTFSWVRTDGSGLQVFAQPFFHECVG